MPHLSCALKQGMENMILRDLRLQSVVFSSAFALMACSGSSGTGSGTTEEPSSSSGTTGNGTAGSGKTPGLGNGNQSTGLGNPGQGTPSLNGKKANYCGSGGCACSNGIDDDGDGLIDADDPECVGSEDNDEATFATGMPGDNRDPKWQDCFFDGNSGAGDDRCRYPTGCLTGELSQSDPACAITQYCLDHCAAFAPKECDCFGCCTVPSGSGSVNIVLTNTCTEANLGDVAACPRCVKSTACQPPPETPPPPPTTTTPPPPPPPPPTTCADGSSVCSATVACDTGFNCVSGCCKAIVR
jgi:hypothetical protein